ncbi:Ubiquitin carboxyl-terminal hydrolase 5 [Frankliniella fusca]|uniref:ubiquitinyl hydrolase 1 n=1 Tax=Frankliniella fusca TaxID=407009 RepID=A0AAE1GPB4_9NEOP|nr:Ubiquitin carboxyl-terminal hydrolase 5 [Frankliniella fusca]
MIHTLSEYYQKTCAVVWEWYGPRFTFGDKEGGVNNCLVEYSHNLDMKDFVVPDLQSKTEYKLIAVTCHSGGLTSGHYTSFCCRDDRWFNFDDSRVSNTTARRVISNSAYLLWYRLREGQMGNLPFDGDANALTCIDNEDQNKSPSSQAASYDSEHTLIMSDIGQCSESDDSSLSPVVSKINVKPVSVPAPTQAPSKKCINHQVHKKLNVLPAARPSAPLNIKKCIDHYCATSEEIVIPPLGSNGKNVSFHVDTDDT